MIDLRQVNSCFPDFKIKFEDLSMLRFVPPHMTCAGKADLADAYHHLALHPSLRHFFQFQIEGEFFECIAIPFGWNLAPYTFTKFTRPVITALRNPAAASEGTYQGTLPALQHQTNHYHL